MVDAQAQDRAHRIGQRNEVRVFRLLTNSSIEERILAKATDKLNLTGLVVEAGKFNARGSTNLDDNKELMESLLKEYSEGGAEVKFHQSNSHDYEGHNDDEDVPDDDQLNEMMATYDGELELYQSIDCQRAQDRELLGEVPTLMGADEIPPWLSESCWPQKYAVLMNDMMTIEASLTNKLPKKKGRKRKEFDVDNNSDEFAFEDEDDELAENMVAGKLMRKRKEVTYDDGLTDYQFVKALEKKAGKENVEEPPPKKRGKRSISQLQPVFSDFLKAVQEIQKLKRSDGSLLAELFLEKPPKNIYPDYYLIISRPISLKEICQKLRSAEYEYFENIELDFSQMSDNARSFNTEQSPVFIACEEIRREFYMRTGRIREKYGISSLSDRYGGCPPLPQSGCNIFDNNRFMGYLGIDSIPQSSKKIKFDGEGDEETSIGLVLSLSSAKTVKDGTNDKLMLSIGKSKR